MLRTCQVAAPTESGGPGASMIVIADAAQLTLEQFAASQCSSCPGHSPEAMTLGTVPAVRLLIGGGTVPFEKTWFFVEHQGKRIGLAIHDPDTLQPLDEVLATFRLEADLPLVPRSMTKGAARRPPPWILLPDDSEVRQTLGVGKTPNAESSPSLRQPSARAPRRRCLD